VNSQRFTTAGTGTALAGSVTGSITTSTDSRRFISGSALGNPTRGDFAQYQTVGNNFYGCAPTGMRVSKGTLVSYTPPEMPPSWSDAQNTSYGSTNANISNLNSNTTTLNELGEIWLAAPIDPIQIGSVSFTKLSVTRVIYA
jgi:hypothetical protein